MEIKNAIELLSGKWKNNEAIGRVNVEDLYHYSWEKKAHNIYENLRKI